MVFCRRGSCRSILKSPNERRSRELRTMRRRVKRSSIVINNSDPTVSIGLSRASCKANTIYHPFKRERERGADRRVTILGSERLVLSRWEQKSGRYVCQATTHKTRSKLTSRDFSLVEGEFLHWSTLYFINTKIPFLRMQFLEQNQEVSI